MLFKPEYSIWLLHSQCTMLWPLYHQSNMEVKVRKIKYKEDKWLNAFKNLKEKLYFTKIQV